MRYPPKCLAVTTTYSENTSGVYDAYNADCSSAGFTLTLQSPANRGRRFISNTGASNNLTVATAGTSATIGGQTTITMYPGDGYELVANGLTGSSANWMIVANNVGETAVTPGTATASKAVVLGTNKDIDIINFGAIGSNDSSLGVDGLSAAQGGDVVITAGPSTTATNAGGVSTVKGGTGNTSGAGGVVNVLGGAGGATGVGGQVNITGGVPTAAAGGPVVIAGAAGVGTNKAGGLVSATGGASTGSATGGVASLVGGAASGATGAGGASVITGGAGNTSGAGGAITITSGAAGATGVAGTVDIAVGAATAGAGSNVTITGGNGAGGTAAGGNINLVPGAAVSTGVPGEVQVNGAAGTFEIAYTSPLMTTVVPASGTAQPFYIATRAVRVKRAYVSVVTHGTSETIAITKDASGGAPGGGTNVLTAVATPAASNTPVTQAASATIATCTLAAGDRLSFLTGGTIGAAAGLTITVLMVPV